LVRHITTVTLINSSRFYSTLTKFRALETTNVLLTSTALDLNYNYSVPEGFTVH